jgi:energy-coupling factor transporter ATP-binding protein EcfA2
MAALKPIKFRIQNYRNIDDSGWIELEQVTALVGRNESGKTALLKALHKFNPAVPQAYSAQKEFPRDRFTSDFTDGGDWPVCSVEFSIADLALSKRLQAIVGSESPPTNVTFTRYYDGALTWATAAPLPAETLNYSEVGKVVEACRSAAIKLAPPTPEQEGTYAPIRTDLLQWTTYSRARQLGSEAYSASSDAAICRPVVRQIRRAHGAACGRLASFACGD